MILFNSKNSMNNVSPTIKELINEIHNKNEISQQNLISNNSPYSDCINRNINTYEELRYYCNLSLTEATVTRKALIRDIDFDLYISSKGKTNRELMLAGKPPYLFDDPIASIELHHIGGDYLSPFAELTDEEHMQCGNNKLLHPEKEKTSWRQSPQKQKEFEKERKQYWEKRGKGDIEIVSKAVKPPPEYEDARQSIDTDKIKQFLFTELFPIFSKDDLKDIASKASARAMIKEFGVNSFSDFSLQNSSNAKIICPQCDSKQYSLAGQYYSHGEKIQRYMCKECGKTYSTLYQTILSESKLTFEQWIMFIDCLYNGYTTAKIANLLDISEKSVHNNKLRLFYALKILDDRTRLEGNIVIDEKLIANSFKGNRSRSEGFAMDRKPRKRGSEIHIAGASIEQISVICALDERGYSVARITGLGGASSNRIQRAFSDCIDRENLTCLYSDESKAIKKYAKINHFEIKQAKSPKIKEPYNPKKAVIKRYIQTMNSFHSRMEKFIARFGGVSGSLLTGYLCLFVWKDRTKDLDTSEAYMELFSILMEPNLYKSVDEISKSPYFRDVTCIETDFSKKHSCNLKRAEEMYAEYAKGKTMAQIGRERNISRQAVSLIIKKYRELGYAYRTVWDIRQEEKIRKEEFKNTIYSYCFDERDKQLALERELWTGKAKDFYNLKAREHNLAPLTIRNIISEVHRIDRLRDPISFNQTFEYDKTTAKLKGLDTINRNKSIFVDYLNWQGSEKEFIPWATNKYGLSSSHVNHILLAFFRADPKRYEITHN